MENIFEVMATRRSIRKYTDQSVSDEDIKEIVAAAAAAPSACNCQSYEFIAVRDKTKLNRLAELVCAFVDEFYAGADEALIVSRKKQMTFFTKAPVVIFVAEAPFVYHDARVTEWYKSKGFSEEEMFADMGNPVSLTVGAAVENLLLAAHAKGLGACFMVDPVVAREKLEKELNCKGHLAAVIPVGYPAYQPREKTSKALDEILTIL